MDSATISFPDITGETDIEYVQITRREVGSARHILEVPRSFVVKVKKIAEVSGIDWRDLLDAL